ncbi:MAG: hypothetical protein O3B42_02965 [Actinomycetota bacterium]|nr:hypothetical protein [Actinomycetota bacterium]
MTDVPTPGMQILAMYRGLKMLSSWVDPDTSRRIARLQLDLDAQSGLSTSVVRRRELLKADVKWRAFEVDGCQKALELVGSGVGGGGGVAVVRKSGRSSRQNAPDQRLLSRMESRASEIADIQTEIGLLAEKQRQFEIAFDVCQVRLMDGLAHAVKVAERVRDADVGAQRRRRIARATLVPEPNEMWSPSAVMGYRLWRIDGSDLFGAWTRWKTNNLVAICDKDGAVPHTDGRCSSVAFGCGIYATKSVTGLMRAHDVTVQTSVVVGLVALEGKVVEHTDGYRAEEATVVAVAKIEGRQAEFIDGVVGVKALFGDATSTEDLPDRGIGSFDSSKDMYKAIEEFMDLQVRKNAQWT